MRKKPDIAERKCALCGNEYKPTAAVQMYCPECKKIRRKEVLTKYYNKKHPNRKPKGKGVEVCCVCGGEFSSWFDGKPYCNKHYLRLYNHGDLLLHPRERTNTYTVDGDVLEVKTASGDVFICDAEDKEKVEKHSWCKNKSGGYLVANVDGKIKRLSRYILGITDRNVFVDHINGDLNDNRKANLRVCTPSENAKNKMPTNVVSGIRKTPAGKYNARITVNRKGIHIGNFDTYEEAVRARIDAEDIYYGEFSPYRSRVASISEICE